MEQTLNKLQSHRFKHFKLSVANSGNGGLHIMTLLRRSLLAPAVVQLRKKASQPACSTLPDPIKGHGSKTISCVHCLELQQAT